MALRLALERVQPALNRVDLRISRPHAEDPQDPALPAGARADGPNPPLMARSAAARPRSRARSAPRGRHGGIRWDRVARTAFLLMLTLVVLSYAAPLQNWFEQRRTAAEHGAELKRLETEHERLSNRAKDLTSGDAIEREARRLGMVKKGERAYVVEGLPPD